MAYLRDCDERDFVELVEIWERSVRASHDFLSEDDIAGIRSKMASCYLPGVRLTAISPAPAGKICGFIGITAGKIEMLFIDPDFQHSGFGSALLRFALGCGATLVDVNEQNPHAMEFYLSHGFYIAGRDEKDDAGRPFPIIHLSI
ncbi:MAG: GNAT family N-acetyltransferase [Staphylococcus sp.]|nr:GNAT family N-acetyltransferase [Staphylococcus sp.]